MTKFKMTLKKSAAVLAAAALTISGLTGIGSEGIFKSETEIVSADYAGNTYDVDYGILIGQKYVWDEDEGQGVYTDEYGVWKTSLKYNSNICYEEFSEDGFSWDESSKTLTLTNFNFKTSLYTGGASLKIDIDEPVTIKLFGENTIENTRNTTPLSSSSNLTIEGPGNLEIKGKSDTSGYTLYCGGDITINNCDVSAGGGILCGKTKKININNAKVSADGGFKTIDLAGEGYDSCSPVVNGVADTTGTTTINGCLVKSDSIIKETVQSSEASDLLIGQEIADGYKFDTVKNMVDSSSEGDSAIYAYTRTTNRTCLGIDAKNTVDPLKITIYNTSDKTYADINYPSIADALTNIVVTSTDSNQTRMAKAWLNYASAAQLYFGYKPDQLANRYLTASDRKVTGEADVLRALRSNPNVDGMSYYSSKKAYIGTSLVLGMNDSCRQIALKHYFSENISDSKEVEINGKTYYVITSVLKDIKHITTNFYYVEDTDCSVYDYIYSVLRNSEEDEKLVDLCCAIYDLGEAAGKLI